MDAYTTYILRLSEARAAELRREAAEYALSRVARERRNSWTARLRGRLARRPSQPVEPVVPLPIPQPERRDEELRRSA